MDVRYNPTTFEDVRVTTGFAVLAGACADIQEATTWSEVRRALGGLHLDLSSAISHILIALEKHRWALEDPWLSLIGYAASSPRAYHVFAAAVHRVEALRYGRHRTYPELFTAQALEPTARVYKFWCDVARELGLSSDIIPK